MFFRDFKSHNVHLDIHIIHNERHRNLIKFECNQCAMSTFSGAEIVGVCREAAMKAFWDAATSDIDTEPKMKQEDLIDSIQRIQPLVWNQAVILRYKIFKFRIEFLWLGKIYSFSCFLDVFSIVDTPKYSSLQSEALVRVDQCPRQSRLALIFEWRFSRATLSLLLLLERRHG